MNCKSGPHFLAERIASRAEKYRFDLERLRPNEDRERERV